MRRGSDVCKSTLTRRKSLQNFLVEKSVRPRKSLRILTDARGEQSSPSRNAFNARCLSRVRRVLRAEAWRRTRETPGSDRGSKSRALPGASYRAEQEPRTRRSPSEIPTGCRQSRRHPRGRAWRSLSAHPPTNSEPPRGGGETPARVSFPRAVESCSRSRCKESRSGYLQEELWFRTKEYTKK